MSWDDLDREVLEEFAGATGRGREWFAPEGYSFRRLAKLQDDDLRRLAATRAGMRWRHAHAEHCREYWRQQRLEHPEAYRAKDKRKAERIYADPKRHAARKASARRYMNKRYQQIKADPQKAEQYAELNRRNARRYHHAHKDDPAYREKRAARARRRYLAKKRGGK